MEGSSPGLFNVLSRHLEGLKKTTKTSVEITGLEAYIQTLDLPSMKQDFY
jgi:hypothetical protein